MNTHNIILIAFIVWSFPLGYFRSKFRKMVYQTDSWLINIKPVFLKEIQVLFGFSDYRAPAELKLIRMYRVYLLVYSALVVGLLYT